jgi:hypothetical protein
MRGFPRLDPTKGRYPDGCRASRYCGRNFRLPSRIRFQNTTAARGVND